MYYSARRRHRHRQSVVKWRLNVVLSLFALALLVTLGRLAQLQVSDGAFLKSQGELRSLRTPKMPAYRGMISDRNGRALAVSTPAVTLAVSPKKLITQSSTKLKTLAELVDIPFDTMMTKLQKYATKDFMYLKKDLLPKTADKILDLKMAGTWAEHGYRRHYPAGAVAAQVVGFSNRQEQGQEGVELIYNQVLKGQEGRRLIVKDRRGQVAKDLGIQKAPADGENIELSLDLRVQYVAHQTLTEAAEQTKAESASLVALDIRTGEILAMTNYPSFNPNDRSTLDPAAVRNRAVTDIYDPGSTLKTFTITAALESGIFQPWTPIDTRPGRLLVGKKWITDHRSYGVLDLTGILMHSSNVGVTKVALEMPASTQVNVLQQVGFGKSPGTGLPAETSGYTPGEDLWRPIERATLAYGYGISVSVLQLAKAYAVLARGGKDFDVSLKKQTQSVDGKRVIQEETAREVIGMLESVLGEEGTGKKARVAGYRVAGKTGTARKLTSKGYDAKRYLSWFAGTAPASNPRYVVVAMINDPVGDRFYGGDVAAPVFAEVMKSLLQFNGVPPDAALTSR